MSKLLLWVCVGVFGALFSGIPMLFGSNNLAASIVLSTIGSIVGIWVWYKWLRYA